MAAGEPKPLEGLDAPLVASRRRALVGRRVLTLAECASTNDEAFALVEREGPGASGAAVFAEAQRAGRGRRGRSWLSSPGRGLLFSVALVPPRALPAPAWVAASAVALRAAVEEVSGLTTDVKWPNDLLAGGRKVCGILVEARGQAVVVGIGVNVCQDPALEADPVLGATATTIEAAAERPVDRARLARAALDALDEAVARLFAADFAPLERAFLEGLGCAGEPVRVVSGGKSLAGELLAIRFDEGVLLQTVNGVETLAAETITSLSRLRAS